MIELQARIISPEYAKHQKPIMSDRDSLVYETLGKMEKDPEFKNEMTEQYRRIQEADKQGNLEEAWNKEASSKIAKSKGDHNQNATTLSVSQIATQKKCLLK